MSSGPLPAVHLIGALLRVPAQTVHRRILLHRRALSCLLCGNITIYTAPSIAPEVNLEELDQVGEILGNLQVPIGTYTGAVLMIGGNPGDVTLVTSADPESGFAGAPSTTIPSSDIQIQGTRGTSGNLSVPITVNFAAPLTVTTSANNARDLEFDLCNPAFIIAHVQPGPVDITTATRLQTVTNALINGTPVKL